MNNLRIIIIIAFTFFAITTSQAQSVNKALKEFQQTEFITQFQKMQYEAKKSIRKFKMRADQYEEQDVEMVKEAYNKTAKQYNMLLADIKADLLNKQKMKFIANMPNEYAKGLELDLRQLEDFYNTEYQQTLMDVTGEADGSNLFIMITQIFQFTKKLVSTIIEIKKAAKNFTAQMLDSRLVEPNRFLYWDEINVPNVTIIETTNE